MTQDAQLADYEETWATGFEGSAGPLPDVLNHVNAFFEGTGDPEGDLRLVFGHSLPRLPGPDSWQAAMQRIEALGLDQYKLGGLLVWLTVLGPGAIDYIADEGLAPRATVSIRRILAEYGPELRKVFNAWKEDPDDWVDFYRWISYDVVGQRHEYTLRIVKYNDQEFELSGPASSLLNFASNVINTLRLVGTPEGFPPDGVQRFRGEVEAFMAVLTPSQAEDGAEPSSELAPQAAGAA